MDLKIINKVKDIAELIQPEIVQIRRAIHRNPELAFREYATSALIRKELDYFQIQSSEIQTETGVVAHIKGALPGPTILLRADIDALPITEETCLPFSSQNDGIMHACGHDMHTASLIGCGHILQQLRSQISGTIRLVFQPAEEKIPGGALSMIRAGVLQSTESEPEPSYCIAQHVLPSLESGMLGFRRGSFLASSDELYIKIIAGGGHAAKPELLESDCILAAAHAIIALQSVISRNNPPDIPSVLSIGRIEANGATNIIPSQVTLEGTFRSLDESWRESAHHRIQQLVTNTAHAFGAEAEIEIRKGYPVLINDPALSDTAQNVGIDYLSAKQIKSLPLWMGSEDFAYFSQECKSLFYTLGVGPSPELHTSKFCPDESALQIGTGFMAFLALKLIKNLTK